MHEPCKTFIDSITIAFWILFLASKDQLCGKGLSPSGQRSERRAFWSRKCLKDLQCHILSVLPMFLTLLQMKSLIPTVPSRPYLLKHQAATWLRVGQSQKFCSQNLIYFLIVVMISFVLRPILIKSLCLVLKGELSCRTRQIWKFQCLKHLLLQRKLAKIVFPRNLRALKIPSKHWIYRLPKWSQEMPRKIPKCVRWNITPVFWIEPQTRWARYWNSIFWAWYMHAGRHFENTSTNVSQK